MVALNDVSEVAYYLRNNVISESTYYHAMMAVRSPNMLQCLIGRWDVNKDMGRIFWDSIYRGKDTGDWRLFNMLTVHPWVNCDSLHPHSLSYAALTNEPRVVRLMRLVTSDGLETAQELAEENGCKAVMQYLCE
jgi:hypothetical protein